MRDFTNNDLNIHVCLVRTAKYQEKSLNLYDNMVSHKGIELECKELKYSILIVRDAKSAVQFEILHQLYMQILKICCLHRNACVNVQTYTFEKIVKTKTAK